MIQIFGGLGRKKRTPYKVATAKLGQSRSGLPVLERAAPPGLDITMPSREPLALRAVQIKVKGTYGRNAEEPLPKRKRR